MTTLLTLAQDAVAATDANEAFFIWGCILFGIAAVLVCLEFFVPSGGLIGILAGIAAIGSIVAFFRYNSTWGVVVAIFYVVFTPIALIFIFKLWINSPIARMMILSRRGPGDDAADEEDAADAVMTSEQQRRHRGPRPGDRDRRL